MPRCAIAVLLALGLQATPSTVREIAVTIDDLPTASVLGSDLGAAQRITADLLAALTRNHAPAIGFVNEGKLRSGGRVDPRRVALLRQWLDAGIELGNHTFSHVDFHSTPLADYERQVLDGEKVTKELLQERRKNIRYFRHPFLHTGRSASDRRQFERFLRQHGYRVAPITFDNYDYVFAAAYDRAAARDDGDAQQKIADEYVSYMEAIAAFYEQQSVAIVGREVRQTLLIHANALNAATFDRLASMLRARGYRFITLDRALADPAYQHRDEYYGPAGITWLHRWALTDGKRGTIFAGEPIVPDWIEQAAR
jgi:peptidoglycan/xylan/chitin deacetylase (PgdA/CDA1 family)